MPANDNSAEQGQASLADRLRLDLGDDAQTPELISALHALREQGMPGPDPMRLITLLTVVHDAQDCLAAAEMMLPSAEGARTSVQLLRAARSQVAVIGWPTALATAMGLVLGVVAGHLWPSPQFSPLLFLAPPLAVLSVGHAFRRALDSGMAELELACPVHPIELALGRLIVVGGLSLLPALLLVPWNTGQTLLPGVAVGSLLDWFAPLLVSSSVSLLASQSYGVLVGSAAGLGLWMGYVALHVFVLRGMLTLTQAQGMALWTLCLVAGLACFVVGLRRTGHLVGIQDGP